MPNLTIFTLVCLLFIGSCAACIGCLDALLMFGAYTTARGMAISRLVIRFFWCGLSSVVVTYIYLWVCNVLLCCQLPNCLNFTCDYILIIVFMNGCKLSGRFCRKEMTVIQIILSISGYTFLVWAFMQHYVWSLPFYWKFQHVTLCLKCLISRSFSFLSGFIRLVLFNMYCIE